VIKLHRLNGQEFVLNAELIQTIQGGKETLVVLTTGNQVLVSEPVDEIIERTVEYRKRVTQEALEKSFGETARRRG